TVDIIVTAPGGVTATSSATHYSYVAATPVVSSLDVTSGADLGGDTVTLTGHDFTGATDVWFGSVKAANFTVDSDTSITAASPAESAGLVNITVTTPQGTSATGAGNQFTFKAVPVVSAIDHTAGPIAGGTTVVITGNHFSGPLAVMFGDVFATSVTINSATQ